VLAMLLLVTMVLECCAVLAMLLLVVMVLVC
jgi:hypothetical protein